MTVLRNNMKLLATAGSFLIGTIACINLWIYFTVLPYAQCTANSHMNIGPLLSFVVYTIAIILLCIFTLYFKRKNIYVLAILALCLMYWGYRLDSLYCIGCANSG